MQEPEEKSSPDNEPWKHILAKLWRLLTTGWLKYITIPVFVVAVLLPAATGFFHGMDNLYGQIIPLFITPTTLITPEERELLEQEEWGLIVFVADSKSDAKERLNKFRQIYLISGHENAFGQAIWKNDIHMVRDPRKKGRWLVVIDMYRGQSSRAELQAGVIEMIESERQSNIRGQPLERWLNGSAPYKFTISEFENTHGRIENL